MKKTCQQIKSMPTSDVNAKIDVHYLHKPSDRVTS